MSASSSFGSVQNKIIKQISALNNSDVECNGLFFTTDDITKCPKIDKIEFIQVKKIKPRFFRTTFQRIEYQKTVNKYLNNYSAKFDFIYYRYPVANKLLLDFVNKFRNKVFFEHVTAEIMEIKLYKLNNNLSLSLSSILSHLEFYYLPLMRELYYGSKIRRLAAFGICNSNQIANYEHKLSNKKYKTIVLGDAVDVKSFQLRKVPKVEDTINFLFLKGASTEADFNGLDLLFRGIKDYKGKYNIKLYLYGYNLKNEKRIIEKLEIGDRVIIGDYIQQNELNEMFNKVHVGISALAVHRKGLTETTTIKTREYFARGLPFVCAHSDPDFSNDKRALRYILELSPSEKNINIELVINWYIDLNFSNNSVEEMHNYALYNLDYSIKMKKLTQYLSNL